MNSNTSINHSSFGFENVTETDCVRDGVIMLTPMPIFIMGTN